MMKIFGHPIHPLFVHFPTALLPMDLSLSALSVIQQDPSFRMGAFYCLAGGVLTGWLTLLTGLADLFGISSPSKKAMAAGLYHGFLNGSLVIAFTIAAVKEWNTYPALSLPGWPYLLLKSILVLLLFFGNYMGGKLVYRYHIGVNLKQDAHAGIEP